MDATQLNAAMTLLHWVEDTDTAKTSEVIYGNWVENLKDHISDVHIANKDGDDLNEMSKKHWEDMGDDDLSEDGADLVGQ